MMNSTKMPNKLIHETSPYLLQHANNPVSWYPWGSEAFQKAKEEDKPVFLSIGYSTCHWCHVMEEESFEDREVADYLNAHFISVKVDKEERPDIDAVYMSVCQALTGSGGWPTTIFMTPEQKPFFAGTYFPKRRRYGQPGLLELLAAIAGKWRNEKAELLESGNRIAAAFAEGAPQPVGGEALNREPVESAAAQLALSFDRKYGGFGKPPKFPVPHNLLFLLGCHELGVSSEALDQVERTLTGMIRGGIFDQIGFGFSRYSTDEKWLAPHFEKMLHDNALLVMALVSCYQVTGTPLYREAAQQTLSYIRREMTAPQGGFYSAQDADIGGEEGKFYTFTRSEVMEALGEADGDIFCSQYDITPTGNFEGKSIPNRIGKDPGPPDAYTEALLKKLLEYRGNRYRLHKDDKILTSWNALMIAAYARAYRALGQADYLDSATKALEFLSTALTDSEGALCISYREGKSKGKGLLDDYAFLAWACLELYEATYKVEYLVRSCGLMDAVFTRFAHPAGGFYLSPGNGEALLFRPQEQFDGAMPSGNSVAAWCLSRLAALTGQARFREALDRQLAFYGPMFRNQPTACTFALTALMGQVYPSRELVCVAEDEADVAKLARLLGGYFQPQTAVLVKTPGNGEALAAVAPFTAAYTPTPGKGMSFYLCQDQSCAPPFHDLEELIQRLEDQAWTV